VKKISLSAGDELPPKATYSNARFLAEFNSEVEKSRSTGAKVDEYIHCSQFIAAII
jgi:hypothetical protein